VILAIAAKTASSKIGELLPSPAVIIALGLIASLQPNGFVFELLIDPELIARATATAGIGVAFALVIALTAPQLRGNVDIDRFRFGSSVALGVLALPILGVLETDAPIALAVLVVAALLAFDPDAGPIDAGRVVDGHDGSAGGSSVDYDSSSGAATSPIGKRGQSARGESTSVDPAVAADHEEVSIDGGDVGYGYPSDDDSRAPWL